MNSHLVWFWHRPRGVPGTRSDPPDDTTGLSALRSVGEVVEKSRYGTGTERDEHPKARGYSVPLRLATLTFLSRRPPNDPGVSQAFNAVHPAKSGNGIDWQ